MRTIAGQAGDERIARTSDVLTVWRGWPPLIGVPVIVALVVPQNWPPWAFMWALAGSIYFGCKWLTWRRTRVDCLRWWRHAGYLIAWPGLDAVAFLTQSSTAPPGREWWVAGLKSSMGLALFFAGPAFVSTDNPYLVGWIGMVGTVLTLHFGLFHLLIHV